MRNTLFCHEQLSLLTEQHRWTLLSSAFTLPVPEETSRHRQWMREHTHAHAHREVLLVLHGAGYHSLAGCIYRIAPGSLILFDSFEAHDNSIPPWADDCDHLWIIIVQDHLIVRLVSARNGKLIPSSTVNLMLSPRETGLAPDNGLADIYGNNSAPRDFLRLRLTNLVQSMLLHIVQAGWKQAHDDTRLSFQTEIVDTVRQHIKVTAGNGITLDTLARISGYNKFHFLRLFKKLTGSSVHAYIDRCRMERVTELALRGCSKTAIAESLGFSCLSAFSRWQKQQQHLAATPAARRHPATAPE